MKKLKGLCCLLVFLGGAWLLAWCALGRVEDNPGLTPPEKTTDGVVVPVYQPPSDEKFVGSSACAECHQQISESYKTHPMARSTERITPPSPPLDSLAKRAVVGESLRRFEVEFHEGKMLHHERFLSSDGSELYDQRVGMDYVVGSGRRAKAYLHQRGDLLFMSPLNWYSEPAQWDLAPGYEENDARRFDRRVTDQCLSCHVGRVNSLGRSLNQYAQPPFRELAIGCENCHGPGQDHISFHRAETRSKAADPIVNPAKLTAELRESVCYQCHLHGEARILRYGRSELDFRPGMPIHEIWTVLETHGLDEDGEPKAIHQVQQMRMSQCYQSSAGKLGCISCHDPHRLPEPSERIAFYRGKCMTCHQDQECSVPVPVRAKQDNSCIACHMPSGNTRNIAHIAQTDHRILKSVSSSESKLKSSIVEKAEENLVLFDQAQEHLESWEQDRALGLGGIHYLSKSGRVPPTVLIQKLNDVLKVVPDDSATLTALGGLALDHQRLELAKGYFDQALASPEGKEAATRGLLKIHYLAHDWAKALEYAHWLVQRDSGDYRAQAIRADLLVQLGRTAEGIQAAEESLRFNPSLIEVREFLVTLYQKTGQREKSEQQEWIIKQMMKGEK